MGAKHHKVYLFLFSYKDTVVAKHAQRLQDLADVQAEKSVIETRGPMTLPHAVPACCRGYKHILCVAKNIALLEPCSRRGLRSSAALNLVASNTPWSPLDPSVVSPNGSEYERVSPITQSREHPLAADGP